MMMQVKGIRYSAQLFLYLCDKLGCRSLKGWTVKAVVPGPCETDDVKTVEIAEAGFKQYDFDVLPVLVFYAVNSPVSSSEKRLSLKQVEDLIRALPDHDAETRLRQAAHLWVSWGGPESQSLRCAPVRGYELYEDTKTLTLFTTPINQEEDFCEPLKGLVRSLRMLLDCLDDTIAEFDLSDRRSARALARDLNDLYSTLRMAGWSAARLSMGIYALQREAQQKANLGRKEARRARSDEDGGKQ